MRCQRIVSALRIAHCQHCADGPEVAVSTVFPQDACNDQNGLTCNQPIWGRHLERPFRHLMVPEAFSFPQTLFWCLWKKTNMIVPHNDLHICRFWLKWNIWEGFKVNFFKLLTDHLGILILGKKYVLIILFLLKVIQTQCKPVITHKSHSVKRCRH